MRTARLGTPAASGWLRTLRPGDGPRLVCFAHAGGGAATFEPWSRLAPPRVRLDAVQLPGREHRIGEPASDSLVDLADGIAAGLGAETGARSPDVFFGHSMGALLAFETVRALRRLGGTTPAHLVVAGSRAPHLPRATRVHDRPEPELVAELHRLGGTPTELLAELAAEGDSLDSLLPAVRADFAAVETYVYLPEPPLPCGLTVLGGAGDADVAESDLAAWAVQVRSAPTVAVLPGDHFFVRSPSLAEVVAHTTAPLDQVHSPDHAPDRTGDRGPAPLPQLEVRR
ncbi:thioesterase domain-containing protein [Micromonosporaceae bacterium B7E4]